MRFSDTATPTTEQLRALYDSVGWSAYTQNPEQLARAVGHSTRVVTAWEADTLVGLARVLTDTETIVYVQDILVNPAHQRSGVGRMLLVEALKPYQHVRQTVLLTDAEPQQRAFYESLGFTEIRDVDGGQLRSFVRLSTMHM